MEYYGIESRFNTAFDAKLHVNTLADAVSADSDYNYPNMVIFVKDEKAFYYLKDGAVGNNISHWDKMAISSVSFPPYNNTQAYTVGETAADGVNMFICIANTTAGESPTGTPAKWLHVGATQKLSVSYTSQTSFDIPHAIPDAVCNVYDTATGKELKVLITRVSNTLFRVESNQPTSGLLIIS